MVSSSSIVRGALSRTFPGVLVGFGALIALSTHSQTTTVTLAKLALTAIASLAAAGGSAAMLLLLRHRLRADAGVAGRRAFLVGLGSFGVMITVRPFLSGLGAAGEYLLDDSQRRDTRRRRVFPVDRFAGSRSVRRARCNSTERRYGRLAKSSSSS